ncbi:hypothetical protein GCM10007416_23710 [Kroppenstedtia guangzhouensis]|uniref:DUF112 domain-containing protein n=1 Tax=Kroppenstedtia guangzhouensis TaxID=1274356 RepID=A0ABQ1GTQ8_9BACL|nr:tripartite tricarboxylate transporter permease [Kroppenstedtia guangzhouensis]GGA49819.1 hypothetical protein GCM10007416_23710 [Kroppenstedtia guangzhouensis]
MESLEYLMKGFQIALQWQNILFAFIGVFIGTCVGTLPGIGPISGVALLIPVTATMTGGMPPEQAAASSIILLAGIYYGAMYGGSTTSILLNTPGDSAAVVTTLDGYQMAKQGRAGQALAISAIASFSAGIISLIGMVLLSEPLSNLALHFGPAEYFSLMLLGLCAVSGLAGKSMTKALLMTVFGLLIGTIGVDNVSGISRFTFDYPPLYQGVEFLTVAVGLFALGEVFKTILERKDAEGKVAEVGTILPTRQQLKQSAAPIGRGSVLGFLVGVLPGAGATLATFFAYIMERKLHKDPDRFGKGAVEGVAGPEAANNGASGGAMIPMLTLGIPGSGTTAVLLGALVMYNIQPGPLLFEEHPTVAWGLIASMFIGNLFLLILNLPLIRMFTKIVDTPIKYLIPCIIAISIFGVYAVQVSTFDLFLLIGFGLLGYLLARHDYPLAPVVLGVVLGPMIENNMRRALTGSNGDWLIFLQKPISLTFLIASLLLLVVPLLLQMRKPKQNATEAM